MPVMAATTPICLAAAAILVAVHSAGAETLEVDKQRSRIQVDASATGHRFTGTLADFTATGSGSPATLDPSGFKLQWHFRDLKTGDDKRDHEMIKWLGGGDQMGSFTFTKCWTGKDGGKNAMGSLTIHGVSKDLTFPFTIRADGDWVTVDGTARIDYKNFGLPVIRSMGFMTVDPKLAVRFHVVGKVKE